MSNTSLESENGQQQSPSFEGGRAAIEAFRDVWAANAAAQATGERDATQTVAERHPGWPPVEVTVDLAPHETWLDQAGSRDRIRRAHMVFIEVAEPEGRDEAIRWLNELAAADPTQHGPGYIDELLAREGARDGEPVTGRREMFRRMIYGSGTIVGCIDLRSGDPVRSSEILASYAVRYNDSSATMDEMLSKYAAESVRPGAAGQRQREGLMPGRLEEEVGRLLADPDHAELAKQPAIRALVMMGSMHGDLPDQFAQAGFENVQTIQERPEAVSYRDEAIRGQMRGVEPSRELQARGFLEFFVAAALNATVPNEDPRTRSDDKREYVRYIVSQFSEQEIEHMVWLPFHRKEGTHKPDFVPRLLEAKDLGQLPQSVIELEAWLVQHHATEEPAGAAGA